MATEMLLVNPKRRRRKSTTKRRRTTRAKSNPIRRTRRRVTRARRNPVAARRYRRSTRNDLMNSTIIPAVGGGLGALAVDVAWGVLPVPAQFKTGMIAPLAKMGGAVAVGYGLSKLTNKKTGRMVMLGAITVSVYNLLRNLTQQMLPQVPLGYVQAGQFMPGDGAINYLPDYSPDAGGDMGEYISGGMGEYISEYNYQ